MIRLEEIGLDCTRVCEIVIIRDDTVKIITTRRGKDKSDLIMLDIPLDEFREKIKSLMGEIK